MVGKLIASNIPQKKYQYKQLADATRSKRDKLLGISSSTVPFEGGEAWLRDATHLEQTPISPNSAKIESLNTRLRCLGRLRAIDYAIGKKYSLHQKKYSPMLGIYPPQTDEATSIRKSLRKKLKELLTKTTTITKNSTTAADKIRALEAAEKEFNSTLIFALHQANLTKGCQTTKDAEKLLAHYRELSSLLDPAAPLISLTYNKTDKFLHCEIQYPITEKTTKQKKAIRAIRKEIYQQPLETDKNYHNVRNLATQEADNLFAKLLAKDDRLLSSQARWTHLPGVKHGFVVQSKLIAVSDLTQLKTNHQWDFNKIRETTQETDSIWLVRTGSPVYIGAGESAERIAEHTQENVEQIRLAAAKLKGIEPEDMKLTWVCLNTDSPLDKQNIIVGNLKKAITSNKRDKFCSAPTNAEGLLRPLEVPSGIFSNGEDKPWGIAPGQKATRLKKAIIPIMLKASEEPNAIGVVNCSSGKDRTGNAVAGTVLAQIHRWYEKRNIPLNNSLKKSIEKIYALGRNITEIASHLLLGSFGIKKGSHVRNFFSKETDEIFYIKSAKTNTLNKVDDVSFLKKTTSMAISEYRENFTRFARLLTTKSAKKNDPKKQEFYDQGKIVLEAIKKITGDDKKFSKLASNELAELNLMLKTCRKLLNYPEDEQSIKQLLSFSQRSKWKKLAGQLLIFAGLALLAVGILLSIPTGIGWFAAIAAGVGIGAKLGAIATGSTLMVGGIGKRFFTDHKKQALYSSARDFALKADKPVNKEPLVDEKNSKPAPKLK